MSDITVNIMSYRYGHLVAQAIESVLWQTERPKVIRVFDDGVGDCSHISGLYPDIELVQRKQNIGIVDNFNEALKRVNTERTLFLGADNWLHPRALELMGARSESIVSCDAWIVGQGKYQRWSLPYQPHGSALYNVKLAREAGGYAASGNKHTEEDSVLFGKMMKAGASFYRVPKPLLYYRRHAWNFNK